MAGFEIGSRRARAEGRFGWFCLRVLFGAAWLLAKTARLGPSAARWAKAMTEARGIASVRVLQGLEVESGSLLAEESESLAAAAGADASSVTPGGGTAARSPPS